MILRRLAALFCLSLQTKAICSAFFIKSQHLSSCGNPANRIRVLRHEAGGDHESKEPDLFEYFDPLLSPHAYPNGISPGRKPLVEEERHEDRMANRFEGKATQSLHPGIQLSPPPVDTDLFFDPTLSPHTYKHGTPNALIGDLRDRQPIVGVLLIDHGSRNAAANQRLVEMATLYQQTVSSVVVVAAHMEMASPTIHEGLETLVSKGVDEIVCHPYFLSPDGRHVQQDIPRLVDDAIRNLNVEIPVRTTSAVGSDMEHMLGAVHSLVQETSTLLGRSRYDTNT